MPTEIRKLLPKRVDFYIGAEIFRSFWGGLAFLLGLIIMFQVLRLSDFFVTHGVFDLTAPKVLSLIALGFLPYILPIAILTAVIGTFARLSSESELIAMKSCGISIGRASAGVAALGIFTLFFSLLLSTYLLPLAETELRATYNKIDNSRVIKAIEEGRFTPGFFDLLIFVDKKDPQSGKLKKVFIFDEREENHPVAVLAQEATLKSVRNPSENGSSGVLKLYKGHIHQVPEAGQQHRRISFGEYRLFLNLEGGSEELRQRPRMLNSFDLAKEVRLADRSSKHYRNLSTELWSRLSGALAAPILTLLGIGLGTTRRRGSRANAILLSLLVFITYWGVQSFGIHLIQEAIIPAWIALNIPNLLSGLAAAFFMRRAAW